MWNAMDMINTMQEHMGSVKDAKWNANAMQEHTGSNKRKKIGGAIKHDNKGRDDLEMNWHVGWIVTKRREG
jgi:hypothetical protein